jgi:hypothetical protein
MQNVVLNVWDNVRRIGVLCGIWRSDEIIYSAVAHRTVCELSYNLRIFYGICMYWEINVIFMI